MFKWFIRTKLGASLRSLRLITEYSYVGEDRAIFIISRRGLNLRTYHILDTDVESSLFKLNPINYKDLKILKDRIIINTTILGVGKYYELKGIPYFIVISLKNVKTKRRLSFADSNKNNSNYIDYADDIRLFENEIVSAYPEYFL